MDIILPANKGFTVYTKEKCPYCDKVKLLLQNDECIFVQCDIYLSENREEFLYKIKNLIGFEYKTFPMVFLDGEFIGGFTETKQLFLDAESLEKKNVFKLDYDF